MNEVEFRKTIDILHPNGEVFELRVLGGKQVMSGYFNSADKAWEYVRQYPNETFYIIFNRIDNGCLSRLQGGQLLASTYNQKLSTTTDKDIVRRRWVFIDIDTKKPTGVSATDEEKAKALKTTRTVFKFLRNMGFEEPIVFDSGNGYGMYISVDLPTDDKTTSLVKKFIETIALLFNSEDCDIDTTVFNLSRLSKCVPTIAKKGRSTENRPHRESKYIYIPDQIKTTSMQLFQQVIDSVTPPEEDVPNYRNNYKTFDIRGFIQKHGISISSETVVNGITKLVLNECVFDHSHKTPDSAIFIMPSGAIAYKCFHNSCSDKSWKDFRLKFEPSAYESKSYTHINPTVIPNYSNSNYKPITDVSESQASEPDFWTPSLIRSKKYAPVEYLKTCIAPIDNEIRGLEKGSITCLSGLSECGKSTFVSELICNMVNQDYRVALFSGEMGERKVLKWLSLQAAGKDYIKSTQYKNFFEVDAKAQTQIDNWLEDKLYIYNNNWGFDFPLISKKIIKCVSEQKIDCLFLDNLMMLNMSSLDRDLNQQQSKFVSWLKQFAQSAHIHIVYVAHPRKPLGIIRKSDVSGSFDITNRCDYLFLVHRVNNDFKRDAEQFLKWKSDDGRFMCSNLLELNKVRDGISEQDRWVKLYFEKESKRLKTSQYENIVYGWHKDECIFDDLPM